jgi:hypothetical protein
MPVKGTFRVWAKETWNDERFMPLYWLDGESLRLEEKGLGAGSFKVSLEKYNESQRQAWESKNFPDIATLDLTNYWIFIQDVNRVPETEDVTNEETQEITQAPIDTEDPEYQPDSNADPSFIWWGFCGEFTREIQLNSGDNVGTMQVYEFGHWMNKQKIRYFQEGCKDNGFNPMLNGKQVGNKNHTAPNAAFDTYDFIRWGHLTTTDPAETDKYFTLKEAINNIVMRSVDYTLAGGAGFYVKPDWTRVNLEDDGPNTYLNQYETVDSFAGENLTDALDTLLDRITWKYYVDTDMNVRIDFMDKNNVAEQINMQIYDNCESFSIMNEQQSYDSIQLVGDRILFYGSTTTYTPCVDDKNIGVFPKWTVEERNDFVSPLGAVSENINTIRDKERPTITTSTPNQGGFSWSNDDMINREVSEYKTLREKNKNVYRDFFFGYCSPDAPSAGGNCFGILNQPGAHNYPSTSQIAANEVIALYPFVSYQLGLSEVVDEEGNIVKKPKDLLKTDTQIASDIASRDSGPDRLQSHQTPPSTEMKFENEGLDLDAEDAIDFIDVKFEPTFYYRTYGALKEYPNGDFFAPFWKDGCQGGSGYMSAKMTLDYDGITLDCDEPEVYACPDDAIFQNVNTNGNYNESIVDFSAPRNEWEIENAGASVFDYFRNKRTWFTCTHWSRFVFSFGSYSGQRLVLDYGKPDSTNKIIIDDDTYKLVIARPGFVYGVDNAGLMYNAETVVVRNDLDKMAERMEHLWEYYSKPKKAVKLQFAMFNAVGEVNHPNTGVGDFYTTITTRDSRVQTVNSFVSTIEYNFNGSSPRITIQTEYPDSPKATRQKKLMSIFKRTKNKDWNPNPRGN